MTDGSKAPIRLAAVQARALPGQIEANLEHAARLIEQAAGQGAAMVVLPELSTCGYVPIRAIWAAAEAQGGRTDRWLAATARRLGIYLGAGAAETDGTDFFNVFTLATPDGEIAGRVYKANAEASIFRRGRAAPDRYQGRADRSRDLRRQPVRRYAAGHARAAGRPDPDAARLANPGPRR